MCRTSYVLWTMNVDIHYHGHSYPCMMSVRLTFLSCHVKGRPKIGLSLNFHFCMEVHVSGVDFLKKFRHTVSFCVDGLKHPNNAFRTTSWGGFFAMLSSKTGFALKFWLRVVLCQFVTFALDVLSQYVGYRTPFVFFLELKIEWKSQTVILYITQFWVDQLFHLYFVSKLYFWWIVEYLMVLPTSPQIRL